MLMISILLWGFEGLAGVHVTRMYNNLAGPLQFDISAFGVCRYCEASDWAASWPAHHVAKALCAC